MKQYLSPTAINIYRQCPRKFYYYINEYPSLKPFYEAATIFGDIVHKIIKRYYETIPENITPSEVQLYVTKAYKEVSEDYLIIGPERHRLEKQLLNFIDFEKKRLTWSLTVKPIAVEKEYVKGKVHGIVDAVFLKGNDKVVVDWKTGRSQASLTEDIIIQVNVYMWLVGAKKGYVLFLEYGNFTEVPKVINVDEIVNLILMDNKYAKVRRPETCRKCEYQLLCLMDLHNFSFWEVVKI